MFPAKIQKNLRFPMLFLFVSTVFFGSFCIGMFHDSMHHKTTSSEASQLIQAEQPCCGTTYLKQADLRENLQAATLSLRDAFILVLLLVGTFSVWKRAGTSTNLSPGLFTRIRWLARNPESFLFSYLKVAFAQGILNPRTY